MAQIIDEISRVFDEFLLLPGYTTVNHIHQNVSLRTPIQKYKKDFNEKEGGIKQYINIPFSSASMQAVSGADLAIALARKGGCSFIFCSQSIESQVAMVKKVKEHKAGFVVSDTNLKPSDTLQDAINLRRKTGHSTIPITENGEKNSKLLGILTSKDYWEFKDLLSSPIHEFYTPFEKLLFAYEGVTLAQATELLWKNKKECLPIVDKNGCLKFLVFRKDYFDHKSNPDEKTDVDKRLLVGAGINTKDHLDRSEALIQAGVDVLCFDSSDGHSDWQKIAALELRKRYGDSIILGGGNVVTAKGFRFLVEECNLDFVKVGIGGGSICITREQKGIGRGQASSIMEISAERDKYFQETGIYVPICSDGGLNNDTHIIIALALGADFVMMGKYFAMCEESPTPKVTYKGRIYKPYWGEGSNRARNWERYSQESYNDSLMFEEGVDAYVPYSGLLGTKVDKSIAKIKSAMCNCGVLSIKEFHEKAVLTRVSELTISEGGTDNVEQLDRC